MTLQNQDDLFAVPPDFRRDRMMAAFIASLVGLATDVAARDIASRNRCGQAVSRARQISIYLAHVTLAWPLARVAFAFGRDRTTAGNAVRVIEELRDDPVIDGRIADLEACIRQAPEPLTLRP